MQLAKIGSNAQNPVSASFPNDGFIYDSVRDKMLPDTEIGIDRKSSNRSILIYKIVDFNGEIISSNSLKFEYFSKNFLNRSNFSIQNLNFFPIFSNKVTVDSKYEFVEEFGRYYDFGRGLCRNEYFVEIPRRLRKSGFRSDFEESSVGVVLYGLFSGREEVQQRWTYN